MKRWLILAFCILLAGAISRDLAPRIPIRKDKRRSVREALAAHFVGMTEAELVDELGPPKKLITGKSPDAGPYRELIYSDAEWAATDFAIYDVDGVVSDGEVNGVSFETPGFQAAEDRCADLWPTDPDRWLSCTRPFRAKPKKQARDRG